MGLSLLDFFSGYERVIIIDCIQTGKEPGTIQIIPIAHFSPLNRRSNHYLGIPEVAAIAKELEIPFPQEVAVVGIEVKDPYLITTSLSPELEKKLPGIIELVGLKLSEILSQNPKAYA